MTRIGPKSCALSAVSSAIWGLENPPSINVYDSGAVRRFWDDHAYGAASSRFRGSGLPAAGGPRRRYCAAILLHCASACCLSEAIGIFAAAVRQTCFGLLSALFTFALLVVI